ncbi:hypothetical protein BC628DRAFT_1400911 [Trametes gibbosa]|nr:hypothetical protein BC628DRAFT_1400911 [Trametes gibbosa]
MWLITGPFDDEYRDRPPPQKSKLLKTGREYPIGRRDTLLVIKSKALSKTHAVFIVGPCSEEQAADPHFIPTLTFQNITDRTRNVERPTIESPRFKVPPLSSCELVSEDVIHLSASVPVCVRWVRVCCYTGGSRAGPAISTKECAELGIHAVLTPHPDITHHLTPTYALNPAIATSLISLATFVKPEWLTALLNAGRSENGELSALEDLCVLPSTTKYRPTFSPALPSRLKKFDIWQPNEERVSMFESYRFIFAGEKGAEAPNALKELVRRGEGEYECFAVESGPERFRQVLAKGKARGSTLVLVADRHAVVPAIGNEGWKAFIDEASSFDLKFIAPEKVVEAVVYADNSYVDSCSVAEEPLQESVLPDVVPNSIENEPSIPPPTAETPTSTKRRREPSPGLDMGGDTAPPRRLPRRAVSRASSHAPSPPPPPHLSSQVQHEAIKENDDTGVEPPQPRRTLVRRAARPKTIVGIDDTSLDVDHNSGSARASEEPSVAVVRSEPVPPTPGRPSRLKRRVGTQAQSTSSTSQLFPESGGALMHDMEEPPHKRFKALFDQSDPDKVAGMSWDEYGSQHAVPAESMTQYESSTLPPSGAQTQTRTMGRSGPAMASRGAEVSVAPMEALMEEDEESTLATSARATQTQSRGMKRKTQSTNEEDVEMNDDDDAPPRTRRRIEAEVLPQSQGQPQKKPLSRIVTRVDMAQEQVHVREKPASKKTAGARNGAAAGEPDKDDVFLKAVASKKRGKKTEDTFDVEFNNLRISKPALEKEAESDKWAVLEDFGDDGDVRGNFMVVLEMPMFKESGNGDRRTSGGSRDHLRRGEGRLEWQGRPDFKKFKKKNAGRRHQPVELVVEEEGDLGIGPRYWKGSSQAAPTSQTYTDSQARVAESDLEKNMTQRSSQRIPTGRPRLVVDDDEDEGDDTMMAAPSKHVSRNKSQVKYSKVAKPETSQSSRPIPKGTQKQPLFIDSDIEEEKEGSMKSGLNLGSELDDKTGWEDDGGDGMGATLRSSVGRGGTTQGPTAAARGRRRPMALLDDDSDDGATFKAAGARMRSRRT